MNFLSKRIWINLSLFYLLLALILYSCNHKKGEIISVNFMPDWDTTQVLENPYKGWYHHILDNGINRYEVLDDSIFRSFPGMDHLYIRLAWSYFEPEEGNFDWEIIDEVVDKYVPLGYGISFRISCKERRGYPEAVGQIKEGVHYATPVWVREAGAKGIEVVNKGGMLSWSPVWDDPIFLEKLENFHKIFAERYGNEKWVRYVDIGSIGDYGEGHTNPSTGVPPTFNEVKSHIDLYLKYYNTQLVAPDGLFFWGKSEKIADSLYNYAVSNGISVRDDSPMVDFWLRKDIETWSIAHPEYFDPLYIEEPTVLELQHYSAVKRDGNWLGKNGRDTITEFGFSGAQIFRNAIKTMHATYIGYHGYASEFLKDNPELTGELLNLSGYWYFPVSAEFPSRLKNSGNVIQIKWLNKGVAPSYHSYAIVFKFKNVNSGDSFKVICKDAGNDDWLPGEMAHEEYNISIPRDVEPGTYSLRFKLKEISSNNQRDIFTGINPRARDNSHYISLGQVEI